jgi:hypothetical protein
VTFGSAAAVVQGVASDTEITVRLFGTANGTVDAVIVSNIGTAVWAVQAFTFSSISSSTPNSGQGSTHVVVKGTALLANDTAVVADSLSGLAVQQIVSLSQNLPVLAGSSSW